MWISKNISQASAEQIAEQGRVVSSGSSVDAGATVSARDVDIYAPYGYRCSIPIGADVLLLPSSRGQVVVGSAMISENLDMGEIEIASQGGARIVLKNDGSIILNSLVIDKDGVIQDAK